MSSESPDRFEPSAQQKAKQGKSASKRIALFVFIGAGIIFTLVALSILNAGQNMNGSNAPVNLFEASRGAQSISIPRPKAPDPEPVPAPPPPAPKPQKVRPAYVPVPRVSDLRKQAQEKRLMAANAPTNIQAFREQINEVFLLVIPGSCIHFRPEIIPGTANLFPAFCQIAVVLTVVPLVIPVTVFPVFTFL